MLISGIPTRFNIPFANAAGVGYILNPIPQASQIGITDGAASLTDGFPPLNFQPVGSGGVPPRGADMNGIMNQVTAWAQWQAAGSPILYNSAFSTAIGGYPRGAILASTTTGQLWLNLVDNNTTNPDSGGSNWIGIGTQLRGVSAYASGSGNFTVPAGVTLIRVRMWTAGGGGGGTGNQGAGAGGNGGAYGEGYFSVTPGQVIAYTVGAGGTGGTSGGGNGGTGGSTSLGALMSGTGGGGGIGGNNSYGTTGASSSLTGANIFTYIGSTGNYGSGTASLGQGGFGGCAFGGGPAFSPLCTSATAISGNTNTLGGGGSGASSLSGSAAGGAGGPGQIIIEY